MSDSASVPLSDDYSCGDVKDENDVTATKQEGKALYRNFIFMVSMRKQPNHE